MRSFAAALKLSLGIGALMLLLTGCWNANDVDNVDYVNAIGINYLKDKKEYEVYLQLLSFQNVAKTEGAGVNTQPVPVWLATGRGRTYAEAIGKITIEAEKRLFWGHVTALLLGEGVLDKGEITDVLQSLFRFYELRYTMWVYGTNDPIDKLLEAAPNFERSRLNMIIHTPRDNYMQRSYIKPIRLHDFMANYYEPAKTLLLPALTMDEKIWRRNEEPIPSVRYNGVYAFWNQENRGLIPLEKAFGLRWLDRSAKRAPVLIENGEILANLRMENPRHVIHVRESNRRPVFDIEVVVKGVISELREQVQLSDLARQVQQKIEKEVRDTFAAGLKQKADLLGLSDQLYLRGAKRYRQFETDFSHFVLTPESLGKVTVHAHITTAGKYTYKVYRNQHVNEGKGGRLP